MVVFFKLDAVFLCYLRAYADNLYRESGFIKSTFNVRVHMHHGSEYITK